tara:strand:- start:480 stop:1742 length:1263 start_codon:yes stop_codon:yes gene_type:complete
MNDLGFYRDKDNILKIQNIKIENLVNKYGSPLFIYDGNLIEKTYESFLRALEPINGKIHYAIKANDNLGIIKLLSRLGCGADVVSIGELKKCLKAGMCPKKIIFSGVGKQINEIEFAIKKNIQQLNIESVEELNDLLSLTETLKKSVHVAVRVNLDIKAKTHEKIFTGDENSKFGVSLKEIPNVYKIISHSNYLKPAGLAIHIGSQIFDFNVFKKTYSELKKLAVFLKSQGFKVDNLDLGGGFGVNYEKFEIQNFNNLKKILTELFINADFNINIEPGRALLADSGTLVTKVIRTKKTLTKKFLIVDAGMNDFIRPTLYNASHRFEPLQKKNERVLTMYDIVGPICETGDFFGLGINIQKMFKNEFLGIMSAGAYGSVMSSNYNARPNIAEIIIHKGKDFLLRKRQSIEKLMEKDIVPDF